MERLRRRTDFKAAARGAKAPVRGFVVQERRRGGTETAGTGVIGIKCPDTAVRIGFTVSRQVGNAVERNRVRRRLREVVRLAAGTAGPDAAAAAAFRPGHDYVLIGRRAALSASFNALKQDLDTALARLHAASRPAAGGTPRRPPHDTNSPARKHGDTGTKP
jgi:ribonuclease P protein component